MAIPSFDIEASFRAMTVRQPTEEEKIDIVRPDLDIKYNQQLLKMKRKSVVRQKWFNNIRKVINKIKWENTKKYRNFEIQKIKPKKRTAEMGYVLEYILDKEHRWIKVKDVGKYISDRKYEDTKEVVGDPPRQFELLRKNVLPLSWLETKVKRCKYVCFCPEQVHWQTNEIINQSKHKNQAFSDETITEKLSECKSKCELTGLPLSEGHLAADHWISKESGGKSESENCVILNKILNEKKNNHYPIDWFCKSLLTNFITICKKTGMDIDEVKTKLINFIQEF